MTPSAIGKLADTPLAHALIYARNRRLSGRLELNAKNAQKATVVLWRGRISAALTTPPGMVPGGFFGATAYELGFIDQPTLDATLLEISKTKRLHGEVLIERKAITKDQRDQALVEQIHRKVHHLFGLDDETTTYAFYDAREPASPAISADLVGPVWRGIRDYPPLRFVAETVRRIGDNELRITTEAADKHVKPRLPPLESALVEMLASRPMTLASMKASSELPAARVDLLAYLLVIAKHVESVSGARTHPSTGALPAAMPSGPLPARTASGQVRVPGAISTQIPVYATPRPMAIATPTQPFAPVAPPTTTSSLGTLRTPAELGLEGITARAAAIEKEDYFQVLGLADGASAEAVRASYMRLAKAWHPDKLVTDFFSVRGDVAKVFNHMTVAQKSLTDPEGRRTYLASRRPKDEPRTRSIVMKEIEAAFVAKGFDVVSKLCQELIALDADDAEALAIQAWSDVRAGDASEDELKMALVKMERANNLDRTSVPAIYHRGLVQKKLNNVFAAFRDFARAVQLDPSHTEAEREVRLFAMRARKGSGEHKLATDVLQKIEKK